MNAVAAKVKGAHIALMCDAGLRSRLQGFADCDRAVPAARMILSFNRSIGESRPRDRWPLQTFKGHL